MITCMYCKSEIDPETCHCGMAVKDHGYWEGHSPVPMGCTCHLTKPEPVSFTDHDIFCSCSRCQKADHERPH